MKENFIGHYRVIKKMGAGGMARVYLAVHRDIPNLRVVLKVLTDPQLADRFKHEADKLALLDGHPNICRIRHFFDHGDDLVIAMDYIDGPTVEERIKRDGKFAYEEAIQIIAQVLDVLEIAHSRSVSHRDIKPSNVMLDSNKRVQVIDFGIAKGEADPSMTAAHGYAGTPDYMAPEQFGHRDDTKYELADIYGVGVTLYEMLCGELPFPGGDVFAIRDAKLTQDPKDPRKFRPDMSKHLEQVIRKAISREPKDRFQTAREMKTFLLQGSARDSDRKTPPPIPAKGASKPPRVRKPFPWKAIGLVVLLAVIAGAGYVGWPYLQEWMDRPQTAQPEPAPRTVAADPPTLQIPVDQAAFEAPDKVTFSWSNQGDGQTYGWELANDPAFLVGRRNHALVDTSFTTPNALPEGVYFWRVQIDPYGSPAGGYSEVQTFSIGAGEVIDEPPPVATGPGQLELTVSRPGDIYINGELRESNTRSLSLELEPGSYQVRVVAEDSREGTINRRVTISAGETETQSFAFTDIGQGTLMVTSSPEGARIKIDGDLVVGAKTPHSMSLREGSYTVSAETGAAGDPVLRQSIEIKDGREVAVSFDFVEARLDRLARQLADSVQRTGAALDAAAKGSRSFGEADRVTSAGHRAYADRDFQTAVNSYQTALGLLEKAGGSDASTETEIRALIESLRRAYEAGDMQAVLSLYPSMPGNEKKGWEQFFGSVRDLQVSMEPDSLYTDGDSPQAEVSIRMQFSDRQGKKDNQFRWRVQFEQKNGAWIVAGHETL